MPGLYDSLHKYDIDLYVYYTGDGSMRNEQADTAFGYTQAQADAKPGWTGTAAQVSTRRRSRRCGPWDLAALRPPTYERSLSMKKATMQQALAALLLPPGLTAALLWYYDVYINWQPGLNIVSFGLEGEIGGMYCMIPLTCKGFMLSLFCGCYFLLHCAKKHGIICT